MRVAYRVCVNEFPREGGARRFPRSRRARLEGLARAGGPGLDADAPRSVPALPFGPGREAYSKRARGVLAIVLVLLVGVTVIVGAVLATGPGRGPLRVVTIPAADLLATTKNPSEDQIRTAMNGHLCRCGTYPRILTAIQQAAAVMAKAGA